MDSRKSRPTQQDNTTCSASGPVKREFWFRYYEVHYSAGCDEYGDPLPYRGRMTVELMEIPVIKRTPCGAWVGYDEYSKKFVNLNWNKRYALPTKREALVSFIARKRRQLRIAHRDMRDAEEAIAIAQNLPVES